MVKTGDFWPQPGHPAGNLPNVNCMNELLNFRMQCLNPDTCISSAPMEFRGSSIPHGPGLNSEQKNGPLYNFPSYFGAVRPDLLPYLVEKRHNSSLGLARMTLPSSNAMLSKREFIIFDQSGTQTSVMYSSGCPDAQIPLSISAKNCSHGLNDEGDAVAGDIGLKNYLFHKDSLTNGIAGEESEMHEDTEEINALLYSDDDNHYSSDDEVTSTGHSPPLIEELYNKKTEEMNEEVASCDGPRKRQRLLDGGRKKLSEAPVSEKVDYAINNYRLDTKSSYTVGGSQGHRMDPELGKFSSKKDKIRETLRLLETMVPGAEGRHPMLVIDEAIDYLKSLKLKAKAMGLAATLPHRYVGQGYHGGRKKW